MDCLSVLAAIHLVVFLQPDDGTAKSPFLRLRHPGWESWLGGTVVLLAIPVFLRRWAIYSITSLRLILRNGYTGREIAAMPLERVGEVSIKQGPIARVLGIGTVVVRDASGAEVFRFRGIAEPDVIRNRIMALKPRLETQRVAP